MLIIEIYQPTFSVEPFICGDSDIFIYFSHFAQLLEISVHCLIGIEWEYQVTITQYNLYLLIPSKLSWMANMLSEDKSVCIVDAMKALYSSEVYSKLEDESTKA